MGWLNISEGAAFSLTGFALYLSLENPRWLVVVAGLFPLWVCLSALSARLARAQSLQVERETLVRGFRVQAAQFRSQFSPHWMGLARRASAAFSPEGRPSTGSALGAGVGALAFFYAVPIWGGAVVWLGAALFGFAEKRRLRFRLYRRRLMEEHRQHLCQALSENLAGTRTFQSFGAERFVERMLAQRLDRFAKISSQASTGETWPELALSVAVPVAGFYGLALCLRSDPAAVAGLVFLAAILFFQAHRLARAWVRRGRAQTLEVPEPSVRWSEEKAEAGRVASVRVGDVFIGDSRHLIGPVSLDLNRGGAGARPPPDRAAAPRLLTALSGRARLRSGWADARDASGRV
ncbi:hypothetical protein K2X33_02935, partial [bacterium]|nr:hypothetical protein [bacterium]